MSIRRKHLKLLLKVLSENGIVQDISYLNPFYDEPRCHYYSAALNTPAVDGKKKTRILKRKSELSSGGASFFSKKSALLKCLVETIERYNTFSYPSTPELRGTFESLQKKKQLLDPSVFTSRKSSRKLSLDWVKGVNFITDTPVFIPSDTVYIYPRFQQHEDMLAVPITSGAAAGIAPEEVLLNGILEVIERDATMSAYLTKSRVPKIDWKSLPNGKLRRIIQYCLKYNLDPHIFDITNDLQIPTFLVVLIDKTGLGPSVTVGSKSGFNAEETILSALEEACVLRIWPRSQFIQKKTNRMPVKPGELTNNSQRCLFWSAPDMPKHLKHLLKQSPQKMAFKENNFTVPQQLSKIKKIFKIRNFQIYFADITLPLFSSLGYYVYRVVIPGLQPLYLQESYMINKALHHLSLKQSRLKAVAHHFGQNRFHINTIPHPFP